MTEESIRHNGGSTSHAQLSPTKEVSLFHGFQIQWFKSPFWNSSWNSITCVSQTSLLQGNKKNGSREEGVFFQRFHYRVGWVYGSEPEMRKNALVAGAWWSRAVHITAARKQRNRKGPRAKQPVKGMYPRATHPLTRPSLPAFYLQLSNANLQSVHGFNLWNPLTSTSKCVLCS